MFKSNSRVIRNLAKVTNLRKVQALLLAIVLLAFALRMVQIGQLRMWGDEGFSVYSANRDLISISFESKDVDPHPPLYYYLLHFYLPIAGFSELSIRFFSVFFGTATVALIFDLGKKMFDTRVGILAAAIAALAPFGVQYSQEVRMYALVMFLGAVALWFFVQIANSEWRIAKPNAISPSPSPNRRLWLSFFVSMLLTQYSLYQAAFIFVAQGIFLLPFLRRRFAFIARWLGISVAIVVLFIPWLLTHSSSAIADVQDVAGDTVPMNVPTFLARGFAAIAAGPTIPLNNALTLAALVAVVIVIGLGTALITRAAKVNDWLLVAFVAVPMISLYPIYFLAPLYRGRLFAVAFVPLMLLVARCAMLIISRARVAAIPIALLIVGTSAYSLNSYYFVYNRYSAGVEDYIPAIQMIEQRTQPGDVVLFHAYWQEGYFLSHYQGAPLTYAALENQADLAAAVSQPRNVWAIIQALPFHPVENWLAQNAFPLGESDFGQMRVLAYRAGTPARGEKFATPVVFDNGIALLGYHINDTPVESGRGIVTLQLDWQAAQKIVRDHTISVRVTNAAGDLVWAQTDSQPSSGTQPTSLWQPGQTYTDRHALIIPAGTPPGMYAIQVVMNDVKTGATVNIVAPANFRGKALLLDTVAVIRPQIAPLAPTIPNPIDAQWNEIALVGTGSISDEIGPGGSLLLTLFWQARQKPTRDYDIHVLVFDSAGGWRASDIHRPANDNFPTSAWNAGETWVDKFQIPFDAGSAPGDASIFVFVTDKKSDATLPLQTAAPTRDLEIKGLVAPQNMLVHAVRVAILRIVETQIGK
jgi:mannosyltransferase